MRRCLCWLAVLLALPAAAEPRTDYAYAWPLALPGEAPAWQIELTPEMVAASVNADLRDLEVFDATGRSMPLGPMVPSPRPVVDVELPRFFIPRALADDSRAIRLRIETASAGGARVDATLGEPGDRVPAPDLLLDARDLDFPVEALVLGWEETDADVRLRVRVEGSDDLETWRTAVASATVLRLAGSGEVLDKRAIELPSTRARFYRLRLLEGVFPDGLRAAARHLGRAATASPRWLEAVLVSDAIETVQGERRGVYVYELPAAMPFDRVRVEPVDGPSLVRIRLQSRAGERWLERAQFPLLRIGGGGQTTPDAVFTPRSGPTTWRLVTSPPLAAAPVVRLGYRPTHLVFLPQGEPPYAIAAGSQLRRRTDAPTPAALRDLRERLGERWDPPIAATGDRVVWGGEAAWERPLPWRTLALWAVLVAGAGVVAVLALQMLRRGPEAP